MDMKKNDGRRAAIAGVVLLVLYHLVVFLSPFERWDVFWISYGFALAAFAVVGVAMYIAFIKSPDAKSRFYGFPIARVGVIGGGVQLAVGLFIMLIGAYVPEWAALLVHAIILGATVIGLVSVEAVVEEIHVQDQKLKKDVTLMRGLQSKVHQMTTQTDNAAVRALAEEFRFSDPVTNDALREVEADLAAMIDELQAAVVENDEESVQQLCKKTGALLAERNRLCKLNK